MDGCLQFLGHYELADETRQMMVGQSHKSGELCTNSEEFRQLVSQTLQMIVATKEYLYA